MGINGKEEHNDEEDKGNMVSSPTNDHLMFFSPYCYGSEF